MAAKKITKVIKLQIAAGKATMAPPVGPALGQAGVNGQQFCMQFNDATKDKMGYFIPVVITSSNSFFGRHKRLHNLVPPYQLSARAQTHVVHSLLV